MDSIPLPLIDGPREALVKWLKEKYPNAINIEDAADKLILKYSLHNNSRPEVSVEDRNKLMDWVNQNYGKI